MRTLTALLLAFAVLPLVGCGDKPAEETTTQTPETPSEPGPLAKALQEKRDAGMKQMPAEVVKVFQKAGKDLAATGLADRAMNVGDAAPAFTLKDALGSDVTLQSLLDKGPVVVAFYRGKW